MEQTRITVEQAKAQFPTEADRTAEYARLDALETQCADDEGLMDEIDYRRGMIQHSGLNL